MSFLLRLLLWSALARILLSVVCDLVCILLMVPLWKVRNGVSQRKRRILDSHRARDHAVIAAMWREIEVPVSAERRLAMRSQLAAMKVSSDRMFQRVRPKLFEHAVDHLGELLSKRNASNSHRLTDLQSILEAKRPTIAAELMFWLLVTDQWREEQLGCLTETATRRAAGNEEEFARHFTREVIASVRDRIRIEARERFWWAVERITLLAALYDLLKRLFGPKH